MLLGALILIIALGMACIELPKALIPTPPPPATSTSVRPAAATTATLTLTSGPEPQRKRISFPPGGTGAMEQGNIAALGLTGYVVAAQAGQTMSVKVISPQDQVILVIFGADGTVLLSDHVSATNWSGTLPSTQDYYIDLKSYANAAVNYTLEVTIPPQPGPSPQPTAKRIRFQPGATSAIEQGSLAAGGTDRYVLAAMADQIMSVNLSSSQRNVILAIWGADGTVLISDHEGATDWSGQLPSTQDYYIDAKSVGDTAANYTLQVTIPPKPEPSPEPAAKRIRFQPGATSAVEHGTVAAGGMDRYVLKAMAGQTMSVNVSSLQGQVILVIYGADGTVLISDHAGTTHWSGRLPSTQDYYIDARSVATVAVEYRLQVTIPPEPGPQPTTKRIRFAPGGTTAVEDGSVAAGGADRYVLEAMAGQIMSVEVSSSQGQVILVIWGADGTVLISDHAGATDWSGQLPSTQDYYISVQSVGSVTANYTLEVTIPPRR